MAQCAQYLTTPSLPLPRMGALAPQHRSCMTHAALMPSALMRVPARTWGDSHAHHRHTVVPSDPHSCTFRPRPSCPPCCCRRTSSLATLPTTLLCSTCTVARCLAAQARPPPGTCCTPGTASVRARWPRPPLSVIGSAVLLCCFTRFVLQSACKQESRRPAHNHGALLQPLSPYSWSGFGCNRHGFCCSTVAAAAAVSSLAGTVALVVASAHDGPQQSLSVFLD